MANPAALVTGASAGIGLAIAEMLAERGHDLTLVARNERRLASVAARLRALGVQVQEIVADLGQEPDVLRMAQGHADAYGRLDVLVNNAGIDYHAYVDSLVSEELRHVFAVNVFGPILLSRECLPQLRDTASRHGVSPLIVNLSSVVAHNGQEAISAYSASKGAITAFTQALALEEARNGIKVASVAPGLVDTDMTAHARDAVPQDQMARASDVAEYVRFLMRLSPTAIVTEAVIQRPGTERYKA